MGQHGLNERVRDMGRKGCTRKVLSVDLSTRRNERKPRARFFSAGKSPTQGHVSPMRSCPCGSGTGRV